MSLPFRVKMSVVILKRGILRMTSSLVAHQIEQIDFFFFQRSQTNKGYLQCVVFLQIFSLS